MGYLNWLRSMRQRFGELFVTAAQTKELARSTAEQLQAERAAAEQRHRETQGCLTLALEEVASVTQRLDALTAEQASRDAREQEFRGDVILGLRRVHAEEAWHRRELRRQRETEEYDRAYADPNPLISVVIATYDRLELLRGRAIPSILAQTYRNFEIVIVGDAAPYSAAEVTEGFEHAPIRYVNWPTRAPYPEDNVRAWRVAGVLPFNQGVALADGRWIAPFADDDAMRPDHLSTLLEHAVTYRLEFAYGQLAQHEPDAIIGVYPPRHGAIGLQGALMHRALDSFGLEFADADFGVPSDWGLVERLLRAGVRIGMVDKVVADYFPSMRQAEGSPPGGCGS